MTLDRPLVLATKNKGKISEFRELFRRSDMEIKTLSDFGPIPPVIEDGDTFEENAVKKAQFTARVLGVPALADDSGLAVKALGGAPGVFSSRYAGENADDDANNRKLLNEMAGVEDRSAAFMCVLVIAVPRGPALVYEGRCEGMIAEKPEGDGGFGYDTLFYYPPLAKTFAQLTGQEKNRVSHRGKAILELQGELERVKIWLKQRLKEEPF
ncbi:MAG: XTP/dITP diphosphatase [Deltaproteobacteria bacterium]|nr:XTP/dITP diphosphatase [Deltaproteobacteria bacterium]